MRKKAKIWTALISLFTTVAIVISFNDIFMGISEVLKNFGKYMSVFSLSPIVLSFSIGLIPVWSFLIWLKKSRHSIVLLIVLNIINYSIFLLLCFVAFVLIDFLGQPTSPLAPEHIVWIPFVHFWNLIIPMASVFVPALYYVRIKRQCVEDDNVLDVKNRNS